MTPKSTILTAESGSLALNIGLSSLGCIDGNGEQACKRANSGSCTARRASGCLKAAIELYPESRAESVLAYITVASARAKSLASLQRAVDATAEML